MRQGQPRQDGSGRGTGMPNGLRRNCNQKPCKSGGPGKSRGAGQGAGKGRGKKKYERNPFLELFQSDC